MKYLDLTGTAAFLALIFVTLAVYWPGLSGPFLFDDFANLNALGDFHGIRNWETFKLFTFGNQSGPTGRPVAMLSFLLDDNGWPSDPWKFKYTNLMLHLLNGAILLWLTYRLLALCEINRHHILWVALIVCAYWLLHPLNVSTVMYPVQRMAILSSLFVLLGLLLYTTGRQQLERNPELAYWLMAAAITVCTILATLSKENGALLPVFVLVLEFTVFAQASRRLNPLWRLVFIYVPCILIAGYLAYGVASGYFLAGYKGREFTFAERLMTQPRILFDYLYYWFIPHINSPGLLTEDFPLSTSLVAPPTTISAIIGIALLLYAAARFRRQYPLISLAILFYFAGHLIESTVIPLELYFEHRNYLPGVFLAAPLAQGALSLGKRNTYAYSLAIFLVVIPAALTHQRATIWSNEESLAYHWASNRIFSQRAQRYAALVAERHGKYQLAYNILTNARQTLPNRVAIQMHWLTVACRIGGITEDHKSRALHNLETGYFSFKSYALIRKTTEFFASQECHGLDINFSYAVLEALEKNDHAARNSGALHQIYHARGSLDIKNKKYTDALNNFTRSLKYLPRIESAMQQISLLASAGQHEQAYKLLQFTKKNIPIAGSSKPGDLDYRKEMDRFERLLLDDMQAKDRI